MSGRKLALAAAALLGASLFAAPAVAEATPMLATGFTAPSAVNDVDDAGLSSAAIKPDGVHIAAAKTLKVSYQVQSTGYWCGPAATRIAISARTSSVPSQQTLANQLGTTTNGTDHISQVTRVLNNDLHTSYYETKEMPNDPPTQAQRDLLWNDIVLDINNGYALVANIVAPANNHPPGYPNYTIYHYFTIIGYDSSAKTVRIADPASFSGNQIYNLSFNQFATLIPPKGYSA